MKKRIIGILVIGLVLACVLPITVSAAWGISWDTFKEMIRQLGYTIFHWIEGNLIFTMFTIRINPCVYAGDTVDPPMDECPPILLGTKVAGVCTSWGCIDFTAIEDITIREFNKAFLKLFIGLFVLLFIITGFYLIFMQGSPKGRANAKVMFIDLMVGMVLVSLSPVIFQWAISISNSIVDQIFQTTYGDLDKISFIGKASPTGMFKYVIVGFFCVAPVVTLAAIVGALRYFIVTIMAALFPLTLFLYTFGFTKGMGNAMLKFTLLAIFAQIIQALMLAITVVSIGSESGILGLFLAIGGLFGIVLSPLIMLKFMGWIGGVLYAYSSRGGAAGTRLVSRLIAGYGLGNAIVTAGGQYQTGHTLGLYARGGERATAAIRPPAELLPLEKGRDLERGDTRVGTSRRPMVYPYPGGGFGYSPTRAYGQSLAAPVGAGGVAVSGAGTGTGHRVGSRSYMRAVGGGPARAMRSYERPKGVPTRKAEAPAIAKERIIAEKKERAITAVLGREREVLGEADLTERERRGLEHAYGIKKLSLDKQFEDEQMALDTLIDYGFKKPEKVLDDIGRTFPSTHHYRDGKRHPEYAEKFRSERLPEIVTAIQRYGVNPDEAWDELMVQSGGGPMPLSPDARKKFFDERTNEDIEGAIEAYREKGRIGMHDSLLEGSHKKGENE